MPVALQGGGDAGHEVAEALRVLLHLLHLLIRVVADFAAHTLLLLDEVLEGLHDGVELCRDGTLFGVRAVRLVLLTDCRFTRLRAQQTPGVGVAAQAADSGCGGGCGGAEASQRRARGGGGGGGETK